MTWVVIEFAKLSLRFLLLIKLSSWRVKHFHALIFISQKFFRRLGSRKLINEEKSIDILRLASIPLFSDFMLTNRANNFFWQNQTKENKKKKIRENGKMKVKAMRRWRKQKSLFFSSLCSHLLLKSIFHRRCESQMTFVILAYNLSNLSGAWEEKYFLIYDLNFLSSINFSMKIFIIHLTNWFLEIKDF